MIVSLSPFLVLFVIIFPYYFYCVWIFVFFVKQLKAKRQTLFVYRSGITVLPDELDLRWCFDDETQSASIYKRFEKASSLQKHGTSKVCQLKFEATLYHKNNTLCLLFLFFIPGVGWLFFFKPKLVLFFKKKRPQSQAAKRRRKCALNEALSKYISASSKRNAFFKKFIV